ncbi:MAG: VOC family protein [Actinomycetota bacterium]
MADTPSGRLLARVGPGLFQQGIVVDDIDAACSTLGSTLGCGDWAHLPAADLEYDLRGRTVTCAIELAFARSGGIQVELLRPVRGEGLHAEFLAEHGPGFHHLGFLVADVAAVVAEAADLGFPAVMGGAFGTLRFRYLDTWAALGSFVEVVEDPDGLLATIKPWR